MAFQGLKLTEKGKLALLEAQNGKQLAFDYIGIGSGIQEENTIVKDLLEPVFGIPIVNITIDAEKKTCRIEADLDNKNLREGYYFRELGIYLKSEEGSFLYAYDNAGVNAEYISESEEVPTIEKRLRFQLHIENAENITFTGESVLYITQKRFEETIKEVEEKHEKDIQEIIEQRQEDMEGVNTTLTKLIALNWFPAGRSILEKELNGGIYHIKPDSLPSERIPEEASSYGIIAILNNNQYTDIRYVDVFGGMYIWSSHNNKWLRMATEIDIVETEKRIENLNEEIAETKKSVSDGKTLVANAITRKRIDTAADATFRQMADNIDLIKLGWGNATPDQVLEGVTFSNLDGVELTGTIKKQGAYTDATSIATSPDLLYVRIPFGGYIVDTGVGNPEIKVSMDMLRSALGVSADKILGNQSIAYVQGTIPVHAGTVTPVEFIWNTNNRIQIAVPRGFYECSWDRNSYEYLTYKQVAAAIGLSPMVLRSGCTICGVEGDKWIVWTGDTDLIPEVVLERHSGFCNGNKITGSMKNRGAISATLNCGSTYTIPVGYHNGNGKLTVNSLASQTSATATAEDILSNKTAWVNGTKVTGTHSGGLKEIIYNNSVITRYYTVNAYTTSSYPSSWTDILTHGDVGYMAGSFLTIYLKIYKDSGTGKGTYFEGNVICSTNATTSVKTVLAVNTLQIELAITYTANDGNVKIQGRMLSLNSDTSLAYSASIDFKVLSLYKKSSEIYNL